MFIDVIVVVGYPMCTTRFVLETISCWRARFDSSVGGTRIAQKTAAEPSARIPRIRSTFSVLTVSFVPVPGVPGGLKTFLVRPCTVPRFFTAYVVRSNSASYDQKPIDRCSQSKGRRSRPEIERYLCSPEINI